MQPEQNEQERKPYRPVLQEGVHYYKEGGKYVFTERYHLDRGYCCGSGCRHCPYGNAPGSDR